MTHASMLAARPIRRAALTRKALMMSCASFAVAAAALQPQSARAQAFQGTITSTAGGPVVRTTTTPTTETITVGSSGSTINWSPTNQGGTGTIDFLPTGNVATFTSAPGVTDYIVLNRIVPTDATRGISLNGHVISTLQGTSATGGQIWFYSPGGILIGSTAVIDVGSLVLTTNDLTSSSPLFSTFTGPAGSTSRIQVQNGAQINALQQNSYVAMIAPRIEQGGKVRVNGSAAYVAAEGATMSINQGLFDIQVDIGTTDSQGIVHTGETSGPANAAASDNHGIYMVAVPKNQALEMLLGGTIGFDNAVNAQVQNGQIILSAGYGTDGPNFQEASQGGAISGTPADIRISGGNFTSSVTAAATGNIEANGGGGTLAFAGDVSLQGLESASLVAHDGDTITVGGNATVSADDLRTFTTNNSEVGIDAAAGNAAIQAQSGGSIQIAGSAHVSANAGSAINNMSATSGSTRGGVASISAPGGSITIGGATSVSASGVGAVSSGPVSAGGDSVGGTASLFASDGGSLTIGGALDLRADGLGSFTTICCGGSGGVGEGGNADIFALDGGAITINGAAVLSASGQGGAVLTSPDGTGGEGDGGFASLEATFGGSISFGSTAQLDANGNGGNAILQAGDGHGGSSDIFVESGSITAAGDLLLNANASGGTALLAGDGFGGEAIAEFSGGSLTVGGRTLFHAIGSGGNGAVNLSGTGGQGGDGYGGFASIDTSGFEELISEPSHIVLGTVSLVADGSGGDGGAGATGGAGGSGHGGQASMLLSASTMTAGTMSDLARGFGGSGGSGSEGSGGAGGSGGGGGANLFVDAGSSLSGAMYNGSTNAQGGDGGSGSSGRGDGGSASSGSDDVNIDGNVTLGGSSESFNGIVVTSFAQGGAGATGGSADAGASSIWVNGSLTVAGLVQAAAQAAGGNGDSSGGSASAGGASINVYGNLNTGTMFIGTRATGGNGNIGGDGFGGVGTLFVGGDLRSAGTILLDSYGTGGAGVVQGGNGFGGSPSLFINGGSLTAGGDLRLTADGFGGTGATGGDGFGGDPSVEFTGGEGEGSGGSLSVAGQTWLEGIGQGGNGLDNPGGIGGQGGNGFGGSTWFYISPFQSDESTVSLNLHDTFLTSNANGGLGGNGLTGGDGGSAFSNFFGEGEGGFFGGTSTFEMFAGTGTIGDLQVYSTSRGGNGGAGSSGSGGNGGDAFGGGSSITIGSDLTATRALSYDRAFAGNGGSGTTQGDGGFAQGGSASIDIADGGHFTGNIDIATTAFGGSGNTGGDATGGSGSFDVEGILSGGSILIDGDAFGGTGIAQGGEARGGFASIDLFGGNAHIGIDSALHVNAIGGNASNGAGGSALGGSVFVESAEGGHLTGGNLAVHADATSGNGTSTGLAAGGQVRILSESFGGELPTSIALDHLTLTANGTLGSGAADETIGYGGSIDLIASGGSLSAGTLFAQANGSNFGGKIGLQSNVEFGGIKGNMTFGSLTGIANGGDLGGFIFVGSGSGSIIDLGNANLTAIGDSSGQILLAAGNGCDCGGEGIDQSAALPAGGGIAASNLTLNTSGNILMTLSGGADISVAGTLHGNADGIISLLDDGTGGAIRAHIIDLTGLTIIDSADIIADFIHFQAISDMSLGDLQATNRIDLIAGGDLSAGNLTAGDTIELQSDGDIRFGNLTADHTDFDASGSVTGGDIHATTRAEGSADGAIVLGNITAGPNVPAGNQFSVGIGSGTSITVGNVTGAGHVGFATPGFLRTGNLAAGDLLMLLVGGNITTGSITTGATGRVYIADSSMFTLGGGDVEGDGDFDPTLVLAMNPVRTHGTIDINGPVNTGRMQAAAGGDLTAGNITAPNGLTLDSGGSIRAGNLTGQTVALNAVANTTVHDVHASGSAAFTAGGLATFNGTVNSPTITVTSGDIDITEGASLGVQGVTNLLTLNAVSHGLPILIGDGGPANAGAPGQYHLDEDGDIRTASLVINAVGATPGQNPDVHVFDAQIGEGGASPNSVTLNTPGSIFVEGDVHYLNATPTSALTLNAGHVLEVNTDLGSIVITDSTGHLTGTLALNADNVWIGSGSLLHQLEADPNFAGRDAALGAGPATPNQDGFVRAGTITSRVLNSFFAQNSGTADLFAGIDTGAGGLSITSAGTTPATLIIYGRQTNADGTTITNQDFLGTVNLAGTGGFTNDSAVNGCTIGATCGLKPATPGIDMASILGPLDQTNSPDDEDKKKDKDKSDEGDDGSSVDPALRLINTTPINLDHQIDDPVTSGGDVVIGGGSVSPY